MFGYITVNKEELRIKDFETYRSYYCGLCRELRDRYGVLGELTVTYDMTFVIMLLTALYEPATRKGKTRCPVKPVFSHDVRKNTFTEYGADMNIILTFYKCRDDWYDERKVTRLAFARLLKLQGLPQGGIYKEKLRSIASSLKELSRLEETGCRNLDQVAGLSGKLLEEIMAPRKDEWEGSLRTMGFFLGKFIYIMDAFDDLREDAEKGCYNPLLEMEKKAASEDEFSDQVKQILTLTLTRACMEFEKLPIIQYGDILRNILYSGIWCRFGEVCRKRQETDFAGGRPTVEAT